MSTSSLQSLILNNFIAQPLDEDCVASHTDKLRNQAIKLIQQTGLPKQNSEAWRNLNVGSILQKRFHPDEMKWEISSKGNKNNKSHDFLSFSETTRNKICKLLEKDLAKKQSSFSVLNTALNLEPQLIYVDNSDTDTCHQFNANLSGKRITIEDTPIANPKLIIYLESNTSAEICFNLNHLESGFTNCNFEFYLMENSSLRCTFVGDKTNKSTLFENHWARLKQHSQLELFFLDVELGTHRRDILTQLEGENASFSINGAQIANKGAQLSNHIKTIHKAHNTISNEKVKSIITDDATSEYNSLVHVEEGACGAASKQLNKNILMTQKAKAYSRPQLQIDIDDVQCSHGATVGQLNEDEVYYLRSRGIDQKTATSMITFGFINEILNCIKDPQILFEIKEHAKEKLSQIL